MKTGDLLRKIKLSKIEEKLDLLLFHCDLFFEMEFSNIGMGPVYIATVLEKEGRRVEIIGAPQLYALSQSQLRWAVKKKNPALVGFYIISDNYEQSRDLAGSIREWLPGTKIIAGGPLAAALGEEIIREGIFDMAVTGEGEEAMSLLCKYFIDNCGSLDDVPGLVYRHEGTIKKGKPAEPIMNLDELPYPDLKHFSRQQVFQVVSGRGCPYKCAFCFQAGHGLRFRFRSAENVLGEITRNLDSAPFVGFDFIDDAFIMDPGRCREIAAGLTEYRERTRRDFVFFCQGRANILEKHPDLIPALSKAGLVKMQLGVESGDPGILEVYRKKITVDQVKNAVRNIRDHGSFLAVCGFILGGPFENEKTFANTVNLAVELIEEAPGIVEAGAGFLGAYPGTEIAGDPARFGLKMIEEDFVKGLSLGDVQFVTEAFNREAVRGLEGRFKAAVAGAMGRNLSRISRNLLARHFRWAERYRLYSSWHCLFLGSMDVVKNYFKFLESPRFSSFTSIPPSELSRWKPMRLRDKRNYNPDGSLNLPRSVSGPSRLTDPDEILAYELSSGKITVGEAVMRFCRERNNEGNEGDVLVNLFIPFYEKLDKWYQVVFDR